MSLLTINVLKWLHFGQCIEQIGVYIYVMAQVFNGMKYFTAILVFISFIFSIMYMGALNDAPGGNSHTYFDDYPGMYTWARFFFFGIANTIGDFQLPLFSEWSVSIS